MIDTSGIRVTRSHGRINIFISKSKIDILSEQASDGDKPEDINLIHWWPWSMIKIDLQYQRRNQQSLLSYRYFYKTTLTTTTGYWIFKLGNHDLKLGDLPTDKENIGPPTRKQTGSALLHPSVFLNRPRSVSIFWVADYYNTIHCVVSPNYKTVQT